MKHVLAVLLLSVVAGVGLWDIIAVGIGRPADTVSVVVQGWAMSFPILPLVIGLILGHVFWPHTEDKVVVKPAPLFVERPNYKAS